MTTAPSGLTRKPREFNDRVNVLFGYGFTVSKQQKGEIVCLHDYLRDVAVGCSDKDELDSYMDIIHQNHTNYHVGYNPTTQLNWLDLMHIRIQPISKI